MKQAMHITSAARDFETKLNKALRDLQEYEHEIVTVKYFAVQGDAVDVYSALIIYEAKK